MAGGFGAYLIFLRMGYDLCTVVMIIVPYIMALNNEHTSLQ
jgi:hypothetical protein